MKTQNIVSALRNSSSPAACLAAWQNPGYKNRPAIKARASFPRYGRCGKAARAGLIAVQGPELSAPEADSPLLWLSGTNDRQIADWTAGRDFLDHRGWYTDEHQCETIETYAVTLKMFPHLVFYAVNSEGGLRVELSEWEEVDFSGCESDYDAEDARRDCARSVIRSNDSSTGREAEDETEFQRKYRVENDISENRETLKSLRIKIRALAHELKTLCPSKLATDYPAARKAVITSLRSLLAERRELVATNVKLAASL